MINLTPKETAVLRGLANSDYMGDYGAVKAGPDHPVYSFSVTDATEGVEAASMGGVITSLTKKGLVEGQGSGDDALVWFTPKGLDVWKALEGVMVTPDLDAELKAADHARPVSFDDEAPKPTADEVLAAKAQNLAHRIDDVISALQAIERDVEDEVARHLAYGAITALEGASRVTSRLVWRADKLVRGES